MFVRLPRALILLVASASLLVGAQASSQGGKAHASLFSRTKGELVRVAIKIEIEDGWHLYHSDIGPPDAVGKASTVELEGEGILWSGVRWPEPHRMEQPGLGRRGADTWTLVHEGTIVLYALGRTSEGSDEPSASLDGLTCEDDGLCIPFRADAASRGKGADSLFAGFPSDLEIPGSDPDPGPSNGAGTTEAVDAGADLVGTPIPGTVLRVFEGATRDEGFFLEFLMGEGVAGSTAPGEEGGQDGEEGLLLFLLAAVGWGLFTLLMPCTYPMIPITISFFTKQADARGGKVLPLSLAYGAGIVVIFVLIGVVLGAPIIKFATHPVTNLVIGLLFVYFAMVLFGLKTMEPPQAMLALAGKARATGGYLGVFLMGATLVITSFTCTAPFVGSLLGMGARYGVGEIALGMGVFGLTMAIPFVLLSLLPGRIQAMPRSGEWMNILKVTLGFVELAAALKFFSNADVVTLWQEGDPTSGLLSREVFLLLWVIIFAGASLYLVRARRMIPALLFLAVTAYSGWGLSGRALDPVMLAIVPPYSGGIVPLDFSAGDRDPWTIVANDYDVAVETARDEGKLLFVNLTGYT